MKGARRPHVGMKAFFCGGRGKGSGDAAVSWADAREGLERLLTRGMVVNGRGIESAFAYEIVL